MLKSLAGSLLFFAFVSATYAAEIRVGDERPLTPIGLPGPAYADQTLPAVASNGRDFFALWVDQRNDNSDVYGTRIGRDGVPRDPQGIRITAGWKNVIASAGNDYLLASNRREGATTQRLDENGTPLAPPRVIPGDNPQFLVSNGSTYLMVTAYPYAPAYRETAILLDRDGVPLRTLWSSTNICVAVGVHNGNYVIVDSTQIGERRAMLHTIAESGIVTHAQLPSINRYFWLTAAFSGDRILLGWQQLKGDTAVGKGAGYLLTDYDGRLQTAVELDDPPRPDFGSVPTAWWDGNEFGLIFSRDSASIAVLRISASGKLPESSPFLLTSQRLSAGQNPIFASADNVHIILWSGSDFSVSGDIVARTFPSFAAMGRSETNLISKSGQPQTNVRAARGGSHEIMIWTESDARLFASVDGVILPIAPRVPGHGVRVPSVAAGNGSFLVVWLENNYSDNFNTDVLAVRITFDGRVIDSIPIVLWNGRMGQTWDANAGIAFDGTTFVITWAARDVFVARLPEERSIHTATLSWFPIGEVDFGRWFKARSPQVAWTGSGFFVGYSLDHLEYSDGSGSAGIAGFRIGASSDPPAPTASLFNFVPHANLPLAMAVGTYTATFVWSVDAGLGMNMAQVTADGAALQGPRKIRYTPFAFQPPFVTCTNSSAPAIAWNGAEFVVAWTELATCYRDSTVRAIRLNPLGDQLDQEPFDVAKGVLAGVPSIVPTPDGVDIVYSRYDDANGRAPRAFARSLARLPPSLLRRHAVR